MASPSRRDPPGWTTAVAPAAATASRPSRNGKNTSEAATEPLERPAGSFHDCDLDRIDTAHLPSSYRERTAGVREDHRVRFDMAHRRATQNAAPPTRQASDARFVTTLIPGSAFIVNPRPSSFGHPIGYLDQLRHQGMDRT